MKVADSNYDLAHGSVGGRDDHADLLNRMWKARCGIEGSNVPEKRTGLYGVVHPDLDFAHWLFQSPDYALATGFKDDDLIVHDRGDGKVDYALYKGVYKPDSCRSEYLYRQYDEIYVVEADGIHRSYAQWWKKAEFPQEIVKVVMASLGSKCEKKDCPLYK